jgi:PAS domain S-box-containing protein
MERIRSEKSEESRAPGMGAYGENELRRITRAATAYARSLSALIHASNLEEIMTRVCEAIVEDGEYRLAWVGLAGDGPGKPVQILARAGAASGFIDTLTISWSADLANGQGPTGQAIRSGRSVRGDSSQRNSPNPVWGERAAVFGIGSSVSVPVKSQGEVLGALAIYSAVATAFDAPELTLFEQLADELGFAIRLDEASQRAAATEAERRETEIRFRKLFDRAPIGFIVYFPGRPIIDANPRACAKFGYTREEMLALYPQALVVSGQTNKFRDAVKAVQNNGVDQRAWALLRKDGSTLRADVTATLMPDGNLLAMVRDVSEREKAESDLRESDFRYRRLFDHAPEGILMARPDSCVIDANPAACHMLGYDREELIGLLAEDLVAPSRVPEIRASLEAFDRDRDFTTESAFSRKDGSTFPAEVIATHLPDGKHLVMIRDISERKSAEEMRARLHGRYKQLFDAAHDGIIATRGETGIFEVNASLCRITGRRREDLLGAQAIDLMPAESRRTIGPTLAALRPGDLYRGEVMFTRPDGTTVPVEITVTQTESGDWMTIVRDLTERKRAEAAEATQRAADARYRQLFHSAPDAIIVANWDMGIIEVNPALTTALGYEPQDVIGHHEMEFLTHLDETLLEQAEESLATGRGLRGEGVALRKDGSTLPIEFSINPTPDGNLMSIVRDISERRRADEVQRENQRRLSRMSRVASLGEMAVTIAHEINQPLAAIQTNSDAAVRWLEKTPPNLIETRRALERTRLETQRIKGIINRTRGFVADGEVEHGDVDLRGAIGDVLTLVQGEIRSANVRLINRFDHPTPAIRGDRVQLQQVVVNLLLNAIDAMRSVEDRPRELTVTTEVDEFGELTVGIQDNGEGLDPAARERIFNSFFTTKPGGTGLGLSLSRSIIEAHGGRLSAGPAPAGHGAIFRFTLPTVAAGGA